MKHKLFIGILCLIFLFGFVVRLYRFNNPIGDWHSWRQADTSAVSRDFVQNGFDVLHPTFEDISNIPSGKDNPHGYRFVEFPLYNIAQAGLFKLFGIITLEEWGRLITIIASLASSLFLYLIVKRRADKRTALFVLVFSVFIPYGIYYGRTILPDTSMVTTILGGIFFLDKWLDGFREKKAHPNILFLVLSLIFTAGSLLLKPYALFYGLPMVVLLFSVMGWSMFRRWELWIFAFLAVAPLFWWRRYIAAFPEGIPANTWLYNGNGIRFRPAFFRWIFYERLTKLILGYAGVLFFVTGIAQMVKDKKTMWFFLSFPVSALVYICVFATGNVQHDYYQIVVLPSISLLCGFGAVWILSFLKRFVNQYAAISIVGALMVIGFWLGWLQVKDYFNINNPAMVVAGHVVDKMTPKNARIIAPYGGDTSFLYQTNRKGWPAFTYDLPKMISLGADYLVLVNPIPNDYTFAKTYRLVASSKEYLLYDLHKKP